MAEKSLQELLKEIQTYQNQIHELNATVKILKLQCLSKLLAEHNLTGIVKHKSSGKTGILKIDENFCRILFYAIDADNNIDFDMRDNVAFNEWFQSGNSGEFETNLKRILESYTSN